MICPNVPRVPRRQAVLIASLIASTIAFFVASYFIKRWMDENDIPKGMTRNLTVFALAIAVAYGVGWLVDHFG